MKCTPRDPRGRHKAHPSCFCYLMSFAPGLGNMQQEEDFLSEVSGSSTYRISEADRELILSQVDTSDLALPGTSSIADTAAQKLETLRKKEVTLHLHSSTLVEYIKNKRIPRGLRTNLTPNLLADDHEFIKNWYGLCNQFSTDLMFLTVKHLQERLKSIKEEIEQIENELRRNNPIEKFNEIVGSISESTSKLRENILKIKKRKFDRDARDYEQNQVYTWNKKRRNNPRISGQRLSTPGYQGPVTSGSSSTDNSDSSDSQGRRRRSFLGRQNNTQRQRDPQGGRQQQPEVSRPQTRSRTGRGGTRGNSRW